MKLGGISMITFSELRTPPVTCLRSASGGRWMSSTIPVAARAETLYEQLQPLLQFFFNDNALGFARGQHTVISESLKRLSEALAELALLRPQLSFADPGYVTVCYILTNGLHNILVDLKREVDQSRSNNDRQDTGSLNVARRIACREVPPALWYYAHAIELLDKTLRRYCDCLPLQTREAELRQ
jgi:hypothetical protein